ncbi:MAG: DUF3106 domain-containing protein [Polaromonas sp.]|nr:DUF3106 domain-containing protein [Polaromonas sp.]MDP3357300.1 DUF3106 domain-containing protein [Polaromonas sp.]MDP3753694.1 DUF3106 domain-containing protein [Polaromonas sp.]
MTARFTRRSVRTLRLDPYAQRGLVIWLAALGLSGALAVTAAAQTPPTDPALAPRATAPAGKTPMTPSVGGPGWTELSVAERDILQPLASSWNALTPGHKSKWRQMAKSYPSLPTEEQVKMQGRMKEWVTLSPQQRNQARLNFAKTKELSKELTAEEKQAKWQAYQALSDEEKRKLAAKAPPKPAGAAATVKPVAPQKLATVPSLADKPKVKPAPKMAESQPAPAGTSPVTAPDATPARSP